MLIKIVRLTNKEQESVRVRWVIEDEDKVKHSLLQSRTLILMDLPTHRPHHPHTYAPFSSLRPIIPSTEGRVIRKKLNAFVCMSVASQKNIVKNNMLKFEPIMIVCGGNIGS
jgi:hypothetical protein